MKTQTSPSRWFGRFLSLTAITVYCLTPLKSLAQPGSVDPSFTPNIQNLFEQVTVQPDGKLLLTDSYSHRGVIRLETNGVADPTFSVLLSTTGRVHALALQADGKIVVAGSFLFVHGIERHCLARLNADGSVDESFDPSFRVIIPPVMPGPPLPPSPEPSWRIWSVLVQPDQKILLGGCTYVGLTNGTPLPQLTRLNPDGSLDTSFAGITNRLYRFALLPDGKILVPYNIYDSLTSTRAQLLRFNPDGSLDPTFHIPSVNGYINHVFCLPDHLLISGGMYNVDGLGGSSLVRLSAEGVVDPTFRPVIYGVANVSASIMSVLPQPHGRLLVGGQFQAPGVLTRSNLVRFNADGSVDETYAVNGANRPVYALAGLPDSKVIVSGVFTNINGTPAHFLARLNGDNQEGPGLFLFNKSAATVFEGAGTIELKVLRSWGATGLVSVDVATLPGSASSPADYVEQIQTLTFADGETEKTISIPIIDDTFIEDFESFSVAISNPTGGAEIGRISSVNINLLDDDGPSSIESSFMSNENGPDQQVTQMDITSEGKLVIGGDFTTVGTWLRKGFARFTREGAVDESFDPGAGIGTWGSPGVLKIQQDGKVLFSGCYGFSNAPSKVILNRLNSNGTLDSSFDTGSGLNYNVFDLGLYTNGQILVGGGFTMFNGLRLTGLLRLNSNGGVDRSYPTNSSEVIALALQPDGKVILIGGYYSYVKRLNADGTPEPSLDWIGGALLNNGYPSYIRALKLQPDGKFLIAGSFTYVTNQLRPTVARFNSDGTLDSTFVPQLGPFWKAPLDSYVYNMALQPDGKVLLALQCFTPTRGNYLVRLNADGSLDTSFEPLKFSIAYGDNDVIYSLAVGPDGKIYVGGMFTAVQGLRFPYLVCLKGGGYSGSRVLKMDGYTPTAHQVTLSVSPAKPFVIQASTDMENWVPLMTNTVLATTYNFVDAGAAHQPRRFYRAVQLVP